jgi:hypothetical protein
VSEDHEVLVIGISTDGIGDGSRCKEFGGTVFFPEPLFVGSLIDEPGSSGGFEPVIG